jgi:hypothetical protein
MSEVAVGADAPDELRYRRVVRYLGQSGSPGRLERLAAHAF